MRVSFERSICIDIYEFIICMSEYYCMKCAQSAVKCFLVFVEYFVTNLTANVIDIMVFKFVLL